MINSRDIDELTPDARAMFYRFAAHAQRAGLAWQYDWIVTSTYRDQQYQDHLYAQGRTRPGPVVTWTKESKHIDRVAWDVAIKRGKVMLWDLAKTDVDDDHIPDYQELAKVGRELGLVCGADFQKKDYCHFEGDR